MTKRKKDRQYNGQKKKGQTIQWPKEKRTDNTMAKRKKDRQYNGQKKDRQYNGQKKKGQRDKQ
jgi:hypothetical protein